jgi:calcineurin-like phosphoesterase family protein
MKNWISSDLHFSHGNIAKFCPATRGHWDTRNDPDKMDRDMIQMWNAQVAPEDTVYLLGDVAFCSAEKAAKILRQLNGRLILVEGNHDFKNLKSQEFRDCFAEIHKYLEIEYAGARIVMCHYPIFDHNGAGRGSIMLHGHRHGNPTGLPGRIKDVGFDATGKIVSLLDDVVTELNQIPHMYHHAPR